MLKAKDQKNYALDILSEELIDREAEKLQIENDIEAYKKRLALVEQKIESLKLVLGEE